MKRLIISLCALAAISCTPEDVTTQEPSNAKQPSETYRYHFGMESFAVNLDSVVEVRTESLNDVDKVTRLKKNITVKEITFSKQNNTLTGVDGKNRTDIMVNDVYSVSSATRFGEGHSPLLAINGQGLYSIGLVGSIAGQEGNYQIDTYYYFNNTKTK